MDRNGNELRTPFLSSGSAQEMREVTLAREGEEEERDVESASSQDTDDDSTPYSSKLPRNPSQRSFGNDSVYSSMMGSTIFCLRCVMLFFMMPS